MKADRDAGSEGLVEQLAARLNTGGMSRFQLELFRPPCRAGISSN